MRQVLLGLLLVGLVAPLFLSSVSGVVVPDEGWTAYLDPIQASPTVFHSDLADDGDFGMVYLDGSSSPRFAYSAGGSDVFTTFAIDAALTTGTKVMAHASPNDVWYAYVERSAGLTLYKSDDDGATWGSVYTNTETFTRAYIFDMGACVGVVWIRTSNTAEPRWTRTCDDWATRDRDNVEIGSGADSAVKTGLAVVQWSETNLDVFFESTSGGTSKIYRVSSNDRGSFWSPFDLQSTVAVAEVGIDAAKGPSIALLTRYDSPEYTTLSSSGWAEDLVVEDTIGVSGCPTPTGGRFPPFFIGSDAYAYGCLTATVDEWHLYKMTGGVGAWVLQPDVLPTNTGVTVFGVASNGAAGVWYGHNQDFVNRLEVHVSASGANADLASNSVYTATGGDVIIGFDVDEAGQTVIFRDRNSAGTENRAKTLTGAGLSGAQASETNCNQLDGVASIGTHVAYLQCSATDSSDVTQIRVRSASLGFPSFGDHCIPDVFGGGNSCRENIDDEDLASTEDLLLHLDDVKSFPFDFEKHSNQATTATVFVTFAFSTLEGDMGVVTFAFRNNAPDRSNVATKSVDAGGNVLSNICATRGTDGKDYLYGASSSSTVIGARIDFTEQFGASADIEVALQTLFPGHAITASPRGVGCGGDAFFTATGTALSLWQRTGASYALTWTDAPLGSPLTGSVAMSNDGTCAAYATSTGAYVLNATDGSVFVPLEFDLAGESFIAMQLDGTCQNAWIATSGHIYRYEIYPFTTVTPVVPTIDTTPPVVTSGDTGQGNGIFGDSIDATVEGTGLSRTAVEGIMQAFLSTFLIGFFAVPTFFASRSVALTLGVGVATFIASLVVGWYMGILDPVVLTFVVIVLVVAAVLAITIGRR